MEVPLVSESSCSPKLPLLLLLPLPQCASWCQLPAPPTVLSALTSLRVLYLHSNFSQPAGEGPSEAAWAAALGGMTSLGMLSLSACHLETVPEVITGMTSLRCLHLEDNPGIRWVAGSGLACLVLAPRWHMHNPRQWAAGRGVGPPVPPLPLLAGCLAWHVTPPQPIR